MQNGVPQNPGELNKRVESLAANLIKQGNWSSKNQIYFTISYNFNIIIDNSCNCLYNSGRYFEKIRCDL